MRSLPSIVTARLLFVTHAATAATRRAAFPLDEPIAGTVPEAAGPHPGSVVLRGPELRCRQTSEAVGLTATVDERLRDWQLGSWAGRTLDELDLAEPAALELWLREPAATPHGGESLIALLGRVAGWLGDRGDGLTVAVTSPAVVRAALVLGIRAEPATFWRFDVAPATVAEFSGRDGRWSVRSLGAELAGVAALNRTSPHELT